MIFMAEEDYQQMVAQRPPGHYVDEKFSRWIESSDDLLDQLEHDLRCEVKMTYVDKDTGEKIEQWVQAGHWEDENGKWVAQDSEKKVRFKPDSQPMMNEEGIRFVTGKVRAICNRNTFFSNLGKDEKRIYEICKYTSVSLANNIYSKMHQFGISDTIMADIIIEEINNTMELALRRAMDAKERSGLLGTFKTVENIMAQRQSKDQGQGMFGVR